MPRNRPSSAAFVKFKLLFYNFYYYQKQNGNNKRNENRAGKFCLFRAKKQIGQKKQQNRFQKKIEINHTQKRQADR